jgi:hypothetical protein
MPFEAILKKYKLMEDPALVLLGRIVNGADTDNTLYHQPEVPASKLSQRLQHLGFKDDHAQKCGVDRLRCALRVLPRMQARKPHGDFMS